MANINRIGVLSACIVLGLAQWSVASDMVFHTTEDLLDYALTHNAQLQHKHALYEAALQQPKVLGSLADPMVGVRFNGTPAKVDTADFDQKRYVAAQAFPFFGKRSHLKQLGKGQAHSAYIAYVQERNKLILSILKTAYAYYLNEEQVEITKKNKAILENLITIAEVKYQTGLGLQANVLKAKVAKDKLEVELLALAHHKTIILETLKQLLQVPTDVIHIKSTYPEPVESVAQLEPDYDAWVAQTLAMQQTQAMLDVATRKLRVKKDRYLPNFTTQVEYWDNNEMDNQYGAQVMMSVPWITGKNSASVKNAKKQHIASQYSLDEMRAKVRRDLTTLISEIERTRNTIQIYDRSLLKHARLALSNFQKAFEVNKASFIDYFEAEQTLFQTEKQYAMHKNRYFTALATLKWQFEQGELPDEK